MISICIPTYNRANYLNEVLLNILNSSIGFESIFEIVISDNCSIDNTEDIVNRFTNQNQDIKVQYIKQKENIGPENNFYYVATKAKHKYLIILGDDDNITSCFFSELFKYGNNDIDMFILNFSIFNQDLSYCLKKNNHSFENELTISDKNQLLSQFGPSVSFISSIVMKKELFDNVSYNEYKKFNKYGFSFLYLVYILIRNKSNVLIKYIPRSMIKQRSDNSTIKNFDIQFFEGQYKVFDELKNSNYNSGAIKDAKRLILDHYAIWRIKDIKLRNLKPYILMKVFITKYWNSNKVWLIYLPLLIMPSFVFRFMKKIKYKKKK